MNWKTLLPRRVPSYLQDENSNLHTYLEFIGEIFDEISDEIKNFDNYKDYRNSPESRLAIIAKRFGFDSPTTLPPDLMRGVIYDLTYINTTRGTEASIRWAFRLLGREVNIRHAWLPEPERFDSNLRINYPHLYIGDDVDNTLLADSNMSTIIKFGDGYLIGVANQEYKQDPMYRIDGNWSIGVSGLKFKDSLLADFTPQIPDRYYLQTSDPKRVDYRSFVYGNAEASETGVYFNGGSYFTNIENLPPLRIIGERYDNPNAIKYGIKVLSTPYIVIEIDQFDFDRFTTGGESDSEMYEIAQTLIDYVVNEYTRPANVVVLNILGKFTLSDPIPIEENLTQTSSHDPDEHSEIITISAEAVDYQASEWGIIGRDGNYVQSAETYHKIDPYLGVSMLDDSTQDIGVGYYTKPFTLGTNVFTYTYVHDLGFYDVYPSVDDVSDVDVTGTIFDTIPPFANISENYTEIVELRSTSFITITFPAGLVGTSVNILTTPTSVRHQAEMTVLSTITDTTSFSSDDAKQLALSSLVDISGIEIEVSWQIQG